MKEYYKVEAMSNSLLKTVKDNPLIALNYFNGIYEEKKDSQAFFIGSLVDCLLTTSEDFERDYTIIDANTPLSEMMKKFIRFLPDTITLESQRNEFIEAYEESGYSISIDIAIKSFYKYFEYYKYSKQVTNKIITKDDYLLCQQLCVKLSNNLEYFTPSTKYQVPIYWKYKDVNIKCLLDMIIINEELKEIQPIDIKTSRSIRGFKENYEQYGYNTQAGLYTMALQDLYPAYKILPFKFLVIPKDNYPDSEMFTVKNIDNNIAYTTELLELWRTHRDTNSYKPIEFNAEYFKL